MQTRHMFTALAAFALAAAAIPGYAAAAQGARPATDYAQLARDIFRQLVEIDTTESAGDESVAVRAMAQRFRDAGFPERDLYVGGPDPRKQNLVVRLHGTGRGKPILLMGHLDVVEAAREDWQTDPFKLVVKDGYYYGRGTADMKDGDAVYVTTLIRLWQQGYHGERDVILALTADEEGGEFNGIDWLFRNHRELVDAEFALNHDGPGVMLVDGRPKFLQLEASEKTYADFQLTILNRGGHSSEPERDNAIYELAAALGRLQQYQFPFELNEITRGYFAWDAGVKGGQRAADVRAMLATPPDPAAVARISVNVRDGALVHTTCIPTRLNSGVQNNALPQRAQAIVNCRILPGHEPEELRQQLLQVFAEPKLQLRYMDDAGKLHDDATSKHGSISSPLRRDIIESAERAAAPLWPGIPIVPMMEVGSSDAVFANEAGLPVYQLSGDAAGRDDNRMHANDERIGVADFDRAVVFYYAFLTNLLQVPAAHTAVK